MTDTSPIKQSLGGIRRLHARKLGPIAGLAVLAIVGGTMSVATPWHAGTFGSAAAAEAAAPPATAMPSFAELIERLKPAVVSVYVEAEIGNASRLQLPQGENPFEGNSPFEFFFRQFGQGGQQAQRVRAQGSGFFISADGYLLTNNHVVDHAKSVEIKTVEGRTLKAKVVGTDPKTDLAVLKVEEAGNYPYVRFAATTPRVGDWVLAMGNPFGLGGTVTAGIVSAKGRDIGSGPYDDYLQIDAPVNKGNSGGPSFNMQGEVVGVNTAIYSPSGGSVGIAFDIPAQTAKVVADQLRTKGAVERGWIGVTVQPVTADVADSLGLAKSEGALIDDVQDNSPAAKAGLRSGDVVLSVDGNEIKDARDLARRIAQLAPGKNLSLAIQRDGSGQTVTVTSAAYPSEKAQHTAERPAHAGGASLGLYLAPAGEVEGAGDSGVVVMRVDPQGLAAATGLQQGDVILDAGGKPVKSAADVSSAVAEARKMGRHAVLMRVKSADATHFVAVPLNAQG